MMDGFPDALPPPPSAVIAWRYDYSRWEHARGYPPGSEPAAYSPERGTL